MNSARSLAHILHLPLALLAMPFGMAFAAPPAPANLAITSSASPGQVSLTWSAASGATSYNVKRSTTVGGTFTTLGSPTSTAFTDTTAVAGTRYYYRVTGVDGTGEGPVSLTISSAPSLIVDNADATGVTITGPWATSTGVTGYYGTNYLFDNGAAGMSVRFTPTLAMAGRYDVYLRWAASANRATNTRVDVNFTAGTSILRVDQTINGGVWVKVGAFDFAAGTAGNVTVRNDGRNGSVIADAVQFVLNDQPLPGYTQVTFEDEFDGTAYNASAWSVYDNRPNNLVSGGQLHLQTVWNGTDWVEGGLYTSQFMQRFGYYETVMQVGRDDGLNNAFWLLTPFSQSNNVDSLEIDITEAHYHNEHHMNVHDWQPTHVGNGTTLSVPNIYPGYHNVGLEWDTDGTLKWYWDGALVRTMTASQLAAFENMTPLQVMFSTKVIPFAGTPGPTLDGSSMDIANVRVWSKPGWGGALDGNWGTPGNWGPDGVPGASAAAVFNRTTTRTTVSLAGDKSVKELYFSSPQCPAMTLASGSFKFLLGALSSGTGIGGVVVNGDVTTAQTINTAIQAQNNLTFANYSTSPTAALNINSTLTSSATGRQIVLAGAGRVNIGTSINSSFADIVKVNSGAAWLTAANAFTGTLDIQNGEIVVSHSGALGSTAGVTNVASGSTLSLANGVSISGAETVHLAGNGEAGTSGALDVEDSSAVSFSSLLVMDAAAAIGSGPSTGTLTLVSDVDTTAGAFALTFSGSGTTIMNGAITGAGAVTKNGTGTLRLNGLASHTGTTTVNAGTLVTNLASLPGAVVNFATLIFDDVVDRTVTNNWGGTGSYIKQGAGMLTISGTMSTTGSLELQAGTVKLAASERYSSSLDLIVNTGATFDLNAFIETLGPVVLSGGSIINSTGDSTQYLAGTSYDARSGTISARLGGTAALVKSTAGTVTLSGANTFTGGSTVQAGTLDLAGSLGSSIAVDGGVLSLGSTTGIRTVSGNVTLNSGGTLRIRLNGTTAGTQHDQLRVTSSTSTITLGGTLDLIATSGLAVGSTFRIVENTGNSAAVSGTFAGLPQNAEFYEDGQWWRISYTGGSGNDVTLTRITPTAWQTWQATNFGPNTNNPAIAGDLADTDNDGVSNLLEYATAMNPATTDTTPQSATKTSNVIDFIYTKNKAATDVTFVVEWSDTLGNDWSTSGVSAPTILSDNGTTQQIKVTVPAGSGVTRRFVQLKMTKP